MADRYWRGGTGTWNTTLTTNWAATSGAAVGGASVPTAGDNVIFDQAGTYNVTMTGALACLNITVSAGTVSFLTGTAPTLAISGSMSLSSGTVWTSTGAITFNSTTSQTITTNGTTINAPVTLNGVGGSWSLGTALTTGVTQTFTLTAGSLVLNGFTLTTGIFSSNNTNTRSIAFGTNNIVLSHTTAAQTVLNMATATGFTWTGNTQTVGSGSAAFQAAMSTTRTFVFGTTGGTTTNAPNLYLTSGASIATITTGSWFNELNFGSTAFTIAATSLNLNQLSTNNSTSTLTNLTATMRGTGYLYINSAKSIGPLTINSTSGTTTAYTGSTIPCTTCTLTSGTLDLSTNATLTCSSTFTWTGGSLTNIGALNCTIFTLNGPTFNFTSGTISPSTSFVLTSGSFTLNGGTLSAVPTFTHTAGAATFNSSYSMTATSTYTLTAGTLTLADGVTLSTGIFSSSNANTRSIAFGSASVGNINLTHTTATTVVLSMAIVTAFTYTGPGGFTVAAMGNTRTLTFGTTGGSISNAVNLTFTSGASIATLTTASWFKNLDFGTTAFNPGTTALNIAGALTLSATGTYPTLTFTPLASATYSFNGSSVGAIAFNYPGITITMASAGGCSTLTMTTGTIDFAYNNFTCSGAAIYNSTGSLLNFGTFACTTFTNNGSTISLSSGAINPSVSFVQNSGSFTLDGSATIGPTPLFTHTAGTVTFNTPQSLAVTGTYTLTAGTLTLGGNLSTGIFSSSNTNTRSIAFGTSNIILTHTTAAQTVLSMAIATGFTYTSSGTIGSFTGCFTTSLPVTRTFVFGTTGGSKTNAPSLCLSSGASVATITTGSWFNELNFGSSTFTLPATSLNLNSLICSNPAEPGSLLLTALTATMVGTGLLYICPIGPLIINSTNGTTTLGDSGWGYGLSCTTCTLNSGTLVIPTSTNYINIFPPSGWWIQLYCSSTFTYNGGTLNNLAYISCTTFTLGAVTYDMTTGTITPSVSFVVSNAASVLTLYPTVDGNSPPVIDTPLFTQTAGTVRMKVSRTLSQTATSTYTLTAGSLILEDGVVLNTGIFSSSGTGVRSITFGIDVGYPAFINLTHTTPGTTVLSMATATNFTCTASFNSAYGPYAGFSSDMPNTQTFVFGTTGGTITNSPNLRINGSSTPTITTGSWFNRLDFTNTGTFTLPATSLNLNSLVPSWSDTVVLTGLTANMRGPGVLWATPGSSVGPVVINNSGTTQLLTVFSGGGAWSANDFNCTTLTITAGNFDGGVQKFTGSCTAGVLTTTGSPTLVPGSGLWGPGGVPDEFLGTVVSGSGNTWVLDQPTLSFALKDIWVGGSQGYSIPAALTCSGGVTWTGGTLTNFGSTTAYVGGSSSIVWTCTTFTVNGPTFNHTLQNGGTINPSTSFVVTAGSYTYNGIGLSNVPLFTHTAGSVTFNNSYSLTTNGTYTLTAGTLTLADGITLDTGIFSSTGAGVRAIAFGTSSPSNINLTHTTAATVVLNMVALAGFSWTGPGGFIVSDMGNTRTFSVGSTSGGSTTTAPNLTFTTGASVATLTTGSWFNNLNYGSTTFTHAATVLNIDGDVTLAGGTYPITLNMVGSGGTIYNNSKTITGLTIGSATLSGTATLSAALTMTGALTLTQGTLNAPYTLTSGSFASTGALTKTLTGSNITYTITGSGATAFSNTGSGLTMTGTTINMSSATAKTFAGGGGTYPLLNQGGAGALTISGNNFFADLTATTRPSTITFTAGSNQTFTDFNLSGTAGNLVTINSSTAGTSYTLTRTVGRTAVGYLSIRDSTATGGGGGWYAGTTSTNVSNNSGWSFTAAPSTVTYNGNFFSFF